MNGILSAISSFFKKKKEDELVPPISVPQITNTIGNVASTAQSWGSNILKAIGGIKPLGFGPTLGEIPTGPFKLGQVADVGKSLAQSFPRAGATMVATASEAMGGPGVIDLSKQTNPVTKLGNGILFGSEPIKSIQTQQREAKKTLTDVSKNIPLPENIKAPAISGVSFGFPVAMLAADTLNPVGGSSKKLAVKSSEELATVIKRTIPAVSSTFDDASGALKVAWESISPVLNKLNIDKKLMKSLEDGKLIEGEGFVLKRQGDELITTFDKAFKEVTPKIKGAVEFGKKAIKEVAAPAPEVKFIDPKIFADTLDGGAVGGSKVVADLKLPDYSKAAGAIDRNQVEAVKSSLLAGDKINPIVTDEAGNVLDGAHRLTALKEMGVPNVETVVQKTKQTAKELKTAAKEADAQLATVTDGATAPLQKESDFNRSMREADAYIKEQFPVTKKEHSSAIDSIISTNEKAGKKNLREWSESYKDGNINLNGNGDLKLSSDIIESLPNWSDKNRALLNIETPERIIEDVAGADAPKLKDFFFGRVAKDTQAIQNDLRDIRSSIQNTIVDKLGITAGSEADAQVFRFGEKKMTLDELKAANPDGWQNVVEADKYFRNVYDTLLNRINSVITKFGYDPVLRRNDYYTHYQEIGSVFDNLGMVFRSNELPAYLNGLTADFKPGKEFFKYAQPRLGDKAVESAIGAIDKYLEPSLNQIYRTETIQRGRLLERALRDSMQLREDVDPTHITNFMGWLGDYVNTLSGKKSLLARGSEALLGRPIYSVIDALKKKTSANLVGGNISSALTNFIPLTQAAATTDKPSLIKGLINAVTSPLTEANNFTIDGVQSTFLRNRFGVDKLAPTFWQNVADKGTWLFTSIDKMVSNTIVGGKYFEGLSKGMSEAAAMARADKYGASIMADRSFGQLPQIFQNQGLLGLLTQYQVEVNNQLQFMFRDLPKESGSMLKTASALGQTALYSYLFNSVFQQLTGRRPAFDPIDMAASSIDESMSSHAPDAKRQAIVKKLVSNLPFFQVFTQGGRIPIGAGIPSASELSKDPASAMLKFAALYGAPVGGYQGYKTIEGIKSFAKGYEADSSGKIKYPIEQNLMNLIRGTLFGKYSFPEANKFFEDGGSTLGYDQTIILKNLLAKDPEAARSYFENLTKYRDITATISRMNDEKNQLRLVLSDPAVTNEDKQKAYNDFLSTVNSIREQMGVTNKANIPAGTTQSQLGVVDSALIKSATDGLPVPTTDFLKDMPLPMGGIKGGKGKGVKFKVKVKKLSTKMPKFVLPKAKANKAISFETPTLEQPTGISLPSMAEPRVPNPSVPTVRGLRVS